MKTRSAVILLTFVLPLMLSGCAATFNPALLQPTTGELNPKLPKLSLQKNDDKIRSSEGQELTTNSKLFTLLDREMENLCETRGESYGSIDPAITILESQFGWGYYVLSGLTLWTINLVGFPILSTTYVIEIDVKISDNYNDVIWRKTYYKKSKVTSGLYYNLKTRGDEQFVLLFREIIKELKSDLQDDNKEISDILLTE